MTLRTLCVAVLLGGALVATSLPALAQAPPPAEQPKADTPAPSAESAPAPAGDTPEPATPTAETEGDQPDEGEAAAAAKAPKRFIPSTRSTADNSATFPVDI